jgi:hypothetical protein
MTTPAKHDIETVWTVSNVAKFLVGLGFAVIAVVVTAIPQPVTISGVLQVAVLGLSAVGVYLAPYSTKLLSSAKVWVTGIAAVLTVAVPFVATYVDTGAWHNLTAVQWLVVALAVGKAFGVGIVPNTAPLQLPAPYRADESAHDDGFTNVVHSSPYTTTD